MKLTFYLLGLGLLAAIVSFQQTRPQADPVNYATLKQGFKNPPTQARPKVYWWWLNRLTGDAITGEKFTKTNITKANKNLVPWGQLSLIESGVLGPVTIQTVKTK